MGDSVFRGCEGVTSGTETRPEVTAEVHKSVGVHVCVRDRWGRFAKNGGCYHLLLIFFFFLTK